MDLTERNLAPVSDDAWAFLEENARDVITANLSARRVVDVVGPLGWETSSVSLGRLSLPSNAKRVSVPSEGGSSEVGFGVRMAKPLVAFALSRWELDDVSRGALDPDVSALEEAAKRIAVFEESAVYGGLELGSIGGLTSVGEHTVEKGKESYLGVIAKAVDALRQSSITGGDVIPSPNAEAIFVVSRRGGDLELTLGQDLTLVYSHADAETITLELFESFTFRVLEPGAFVTIGA